MFIYNVFLTFIAKHLINGFHKRFKNIPLQMVFIPIIFNLCQTFPFKRLQNPKMFTGLHPPPPSEVIAKYMNVRYYFYADDSQLFIQLSPGKYANSFHQF